MEGKKDYYADLDVTPAETADGIQKAYRRMAKRYHPDHAGDQGAAKFRAVQEAYQVLSDPRQRQQYDRLVRVRRSDAAATPEPLVPSRPQAKRPEPFSAPTSRFSCRNGNRPAGSGHDDQLDWVRLAAAALLLGLPASVWRRAEESFAPIYFRDVREWEE